MKDAILLKKGVILRFPKVGNRGDHVLLLTPAPAQDKVQAEGRRARIRMSSRQLAKNVSYTGGFLGILASLSAHALPTFLTGLTTGLFSGGINKAISDSGDELHKHGKCYRIQKCKGYGLYMSPHPHPHIQGDN